MIRCIRIFAALTPHPAHHAHRIVRHVRRAHRAYRAHYISRVVCYAVAGGMALGGGALLAHPPLADNPWPMAMPQPGPGAELLPPSAFVAPGAPIVWPAAYVPSVPPIERDHECDHPNRTIAAWCREHRRVPIPEPGTLAMFGVAIVGLAMRRRA